MPGMASSTSLRNADLRGAARLVTDATAGLASLVEAVHERIARLPGLPAGQPEGRTRGITGLVYKSIRGVTHLVGGSVDALLALLGPALSQEQVAPEREAVIAALNGVLGDYLVATANPLAMPMTLRCDGRELPLQAEALAACLPKATSKILVLVHGLCMNDLQWAREGHDHGAALAQTLGYTPVYVRYNSGQHISINGRALAQQLEQLLSQSPQPVERLVLLGHSMGGLVARSAAHHALQAGHRWLPCLSDLLFLGTPHHGAPLERAGHWVDIVLGATPYARPFARLGKVRSAGITDLRHGALLDEDWLGRDRFERRAQSPQPVPLPEGVRCFAVATSIGQRTGDLKDRLMGDGLVPMDSALGHHADPTRDLAIPPEHQWVGYGINHLDLLCHPQVAAQLQAWLTPNKEGMPESTQSPVPI